MKTIHHRLVTSGVGLFSVLVIASGCGNETVEAPALSIGDSVLQEGFGSADAVERRGMESAAADRALPGDFGSADGLERRGLEADAEPAPRGDADDRRGVPR